MKPNLDVDLKNVLPISSAAASLAALIKRAAAEQRPVIITQKGYPTGVLLPIDLFEALRRLAAQADGDALLAGFVPDAPAPSAGELAAFLSLDEPGA